MKVKRLVGLCLFVFIGLACISAYGQSQFESHPPPKQIKDESLNLTAVFGVLSDAMTAVKNNNTPKAQADLRLIQSQLAHFASQPHRQTPLFEQTNDAINDAIANPTQQTLKAVSVSLSAYQSEQNPKDYRQKRRQFAKNITKPLDELNDAIVAFAQTDDVQALKTAYDAFNKVWVANERVVRNTSMSHYGQIETAMAMIRVGMESTPPNVSLMQTHIKQLIGAIEDYNQSSLSNQRQQTPTQSVDLAYGIDLLKNALQQFDAPTQVQAKLGQFIQIWASIEGEVRTRDAKLYSDIESQLPMIMAKSDPQSKQALANLIDRLQMIDPKARYGWTDVMVILLREGLEALLIVMALITALKAAGQSQGIKWVMAGVGAGFLASLLGAWVFVHLFPAVSAGANREVLEGVVGIIAVVMMLVVGAWLHSKANVRAWNAYIKKHMGMALSTGGVAGLFGLAFLSVFREGAETILFYVGILPNIAMGEFVVGILVAFGMLLLVAFVIKKTSLKLPIPLLFACLTWLIYGLGFKMLGVSISSLQLTHHLPRTLIDFGAIPTLGIYPSVQGLLAQGGYIVVVAVLIWIQKNTAKQST